MYVLKHSIFNWIVKCRLPQGSPLPPSEPAAPPPPILQDNGCINQLGNVQSSYTFTYSPPDDQEIQKLMRIYGVQQHDDGQDEIEE